MAHLYLGLLDEKQSSAVAQMWYIISGKQPAVLRVSHTPSQGGIITVKCTHRKLSAATTMSIHLMACGKAGDGAPFPYFRQRAKDIYLTSNVQPHPSAAI